MRLSVTLLSLALLVVSPFLVVRADAQHEFRDQESIGETWMGMPDRAWNRSVWGTTGVPAMQYRCTSFDGGEIFMFLEFPELSSLILTDSIMTTSFPHSWMTYFQFYDVSLGAWVYWNRNNRMINSCGSIRTRPNMLMLIGSTFHTFSDIIVTYDPPPHANLTDHNYLSGLDRVTGQFRKVKPFTVRVSHRHPYVYGFHHVHGASIVSKLVFQFSRPVRACNASATGNYSIELSFVNFGAQSYSSTNHIRTRCLSTWMLSHPDNRADGYSQMWYCNTTNAALNYGTLGTGTYTGFPGVFTTPENFMVCDEQGTPLQYWIIPSSSPASFTTNCVSTIRTGILYALYWKNPVTGPDFTIDFLLFRGPVTLNDASLAASAIGGTTGLYPNDGVYIFNISSRFPVLQSASSIPSLSNVVSYTDAEYGCSAQPLPTSTYSLTNYVYKDYVADLTTRTITLNMTTSAFTQSNQVTLSEYPFSPIHYSAACYEYDRVITFSNRTLDGSAVIILMFDENAINSMYNVSCTLLRTWEATAFTLAYWRAWYSFPASTLGITAVVYHYQGRFVVLTASALLWERSIDPYQIRDGCNRTAKAANATGTTIAVEFETGCSNFSISMSTRAVHSYDSGFTGYATQLALHPASNITLALSASCSASRILTLSWSPSISNPVGNELVVVCPTFQSTVSVTGWVSSDVSPFFEWVDGVMQGCYLDWNLSGVFHILQDNHPQSLVLSDVCNVPVVAACYPDAAELELQFNPPWLGTQLTFVCPGGTTANRSFNADSGRVNVAGLTLCELRFSENGISSARALNLSTVCPLIYSFGESGETETEIQYLYIYGENRTVYIFQGNSSSIDFFDLSADWQAGVILLSILAGVVLTVLACCARRLNRKQFPPSSTKSHPMVGAVPLVRPSAEATPLVRPSQDATRKSQMERIEDIVYQY